MFVQTHFQRNRHQSASAQSNTQPNTKAARYTTPHRPSSKNEPNPRICKTDESQDIAIDRRIEAKNLIREREASSHTIDFNAKTFMKTDCNNPILKFNYCAANHQIENLKVSQTYDQCKFTLDCCPWPPIDYSCHTKDLSIFPEGGDDVSLSTQQQGILLNKESILDDNFDDNHLDSLCHICMLAKEANKITKTNDSISAVFRTMLHNLSQSFILIGTTLISKIFFIDQAKTPKQVDTNNEQQFVSKTMGTHLDLVISFSVNLMLYQLETWRLLLDSNLATNLDDKTDERSIAMDTNYDHLDMNSDHTRPMAGRDDFRPNSLRQEYFSRKQHENYEMITTFNHRKQIKHELLTDGTMKSPKTVEAVQKMISNFGFPGCQSGSIRARSQANHGMHAMTVDCSLADQLNLDRVDSDSKFIQSSLDDRYGCCKLPVLSDLKAPQVKQDSQTEIDSPFSGRFVSASEKTIPGNTSAAISEKNSRKLSLTGTKSRIWFLQKRLASQMSIRRSEEVAPDGSRHQTASNSSADKCALPKIDDHHSSSQTGPTSGTTTFDARMDFVGGLGIGQIVSRHALVSPVAGEIKLYLTDTRGILEVAVLQVRGIHSREVDIKELSSTYVKVYLMRNRKCIAKYKTKATAPKTTDPFYHQKFIYREGHENCIVQVIVWGETGKKNKKCLLGTAQLQLDELSASRSIISWYKLFDVPSLTGPLISSRSLRRRLLSLAPEADEN